MSLSAILRYLAIWSLVGASAFSLVVAFLFRSGVVYAARNETGHLKKEMPLKGVLSMLAFLCLIVGFLAATNYFGLTVNGIRLNFVPLFLLNLSLMLILIVFDSLVIDWWVIGIWRPEFLNLPDEMDKPQMKEHLHRTLLAGPVFALLLALFASLVSYYGWMQP
ncbi:MAG: hypothetical protein PVI99_02715 [Anaerolineales bacterium]|jgi:hypothetical protein